MMLQPGSPLRSGEFSTQVDISCAAVVEAVSPEIIMAATAEHIIFTVIAYPPTVSTVENVVYLMATSRLLRSWTA